MNEAQCNLRGLEWGGNEKIARQHVRVEAKIHPHTIADTPRSRSVATRNIGHARADDGRVVAMSWGKALGQAAGQWALTVKASEGIDLAGDDVLPGDWAEITMLRNGWRFPLAIGPVQSIRESRGSAAGATVRTYTITGTDHGGPFDAPMVYASLYVQSLSELSLGIQASRVKSSIGGSPSELFGLLVNAGFARGESGTRSVWALPPGLTRGGTAQTLLDILRVEAGVTRGGRCNETEMWTQPGQTLHQTLQNWCNPLLNEILLELRGANATDRTAASTVPAAVLRERPFPTVRQGLASPWFDLDTVTIPGWLVEDCDLGRSAAERFNLIELMADLGAGTGQVEQTVFCPPVWDPASIQAHGLRPMMETTRYIGFAQPATFTPTFAPGIAGPVSIGSATVLASMAAWATERQEWQRTLVDWHGPNPYLHSGTLTVGLALPDCRPGMRLEVFEPGRPRFTAYIEGVQLHAAWSLGGPRAATTLTITRGHYGTDDELLDLVRTVSARYVSITSGAGGAGPAL